MGSASSKEKLSESPKTRERRLRRLRAKKRREQRQRNKIHVGNVTQPETSSDYENYEKIEPLFKSFVDDDLSSYKPGKEITRRSFANDVQQPTKVFDSSRKTSVENVETTLKASLENGVPENNDLKTIHNLILMQADRIKVCYSIRLNDQHVLGLGKPTISNYNYTGRHKQQNQLHILYLLSKLIAH